MCDVFSFDILSKHIHSSAAHKVSLCKLLEFKLHQYLPMQLHKVMASLYTSHSDVPSSFGDGVREIDTSADKLFDDQTHEKQLSISQSERHYYNHRHQQKIYEEKDFVNLRNDDPQRHLNHTTGASNKTVTCLCPNWNWCDQCGVKAIVVERIPVSPKKGAETLIKSRLRQGVEEITIGQDGNTLVYMNAGGQAFKWRAVADTKSDVYNDGKR